MRYRVTLKPKDETASGWFLQHFRWISPNDPDPVIYLVTEWREEDGVFTAELELEPGEHGLVCHLALAGRAVEIDLEPRPTINQPQNGTWPWTLKVPATATQILRVRYIIVEDEQ